MFDLQVAGVHNYYAAGVNVHNCEYHKMLQDVQNRAGEELFSFQTTQLHYRHRALMVYPSGPNRKTLRGKCLVGSTLINTNQGFVTLDELVSEPGFRRVSGLIVDSHNGPKRVSHVYGDVDTTIEVVTRNGFRLRGTKEHPLLVVTRDLTQEWRRLDELQVGDWIVSRTPDNNPQFGNHYVSKELATILGYMVANGYRNEVSSDDPRVIRRLRSCVKTLTGRRMKSLRSSDQRSATHLLPGTGKGGVSFRTRFLEPLGYTAQLSAEKNIPQAIRNAPQSVLHEFLEAYFECDSGINGGSKSGAPSEIEVTSANRQLVEQLHVILMHVYDILGRVITTTVKTSKGQTPYWILSFTGADAWTFLQTFKRAKVQKYVDRFRDVPRGYGSDRRSVPYLREYAHNVWQRKRVVLPSGNYSPKVRLADGSESLMRRPPSLMGITSARSSTRPLPEALAYSDSELIPFLTAINPRAARRVQLFRERGAHYEEVIGVVEHPQVVPVYDITVPDGHAFTANACVSHNTRFFAATDEFDFFDGREDSEAVKMNGKEVRTSLNNSLTNVRIEWENLVKRGVVNAPGAVGQYVSSPDHAMGVLTQLVAAKENSRRILALNLATWELHPKLTRKAIIRAFDPDPLRLERDYGARPPLNANPFIEDPAVVERMAQDRPNRVQIVCEQKKKEDRIRLIPRISKMVPPQKIRASVLALDAGYSNNSFALAVLSPPINTAAGNSAKVVVHALVEVMALRGQGTIDFNAVYANLITPIVEAFNVQALLADRWNSLKLLHDAENDFGIHVEQYSLRYSDFTYIKSYMESGAFEIPRFTEKDQGKRLRPDLTKYPQCFAGAPVDHFFFQAVTVRDLHKTVDKGIGLTDDLWRAVALGSRFVLDEEFAAKHLRGSMARKATGGIVAGTYMNSVSGYGNNEAGQRTAPGLDQREMRSNVAAASTGLGIAMATPGYFARTPK